MYGCMYLWIARLTDREINVLMGGWKSDLMGNRWFCGGNGRVYRRTYGCMSKRVDGRTDG